MNCLLHAEKEVPSVFLAGAFGLYVQHALSKLELWTGPVGEVKKDLVNGQEICERWNQACSTLTVQLWKRYGPHPWKGDKFVPENLVAFSKRLEEVCFLRWW